MLRPLFSFLVKIKQKIMPKIFIPAADRNRQPILEVLEKIFQNELEKPLNVLEISSGTGQHVTYFAKTFSHWQWQPSDCTDSYLSSLIAYVRDAQLENIKKPLFIDVTTDSNEWGDGNLKNNVDLMININMIHITPIECSYGLFTAAGNLLKHGGRLITYGPYAVDGVLAPESNVRFDAGLKSQDPSWGIRDLSLLRELGEKNGLVLENAIDMPSNNKCLCFLKS